MTDKGYIVEARFGPRHNVTHWHPGDELFEGFPTNQIWFSGIAQLDENDRPVAAEVPVVFLADGDTVYMGMNHGTIQHVSLEPDLDNMGLAEKFWLPPEPVSPPIRARMRGHRVTGLAKFRGDIYDASGRGLYNTTTGEQLDGRVIGSLEVARRKLCFVPCEGEQVTFRGRQQPMYIGALINADTMEPIMDGIQPAGGDPPRRFKHLVVGDRVYTAYFRDSRTLVICEQKWGVSRRYDSYLAPHEADLLGFAEHDGQAFANFRCEDGRYRVLSAVPEGFADRERLYTAPAGYGITSMASAGDLGMLIAAGKEDHGMVVSHKHPRTPILEAEAPIRVTKL